MKRRIIVRLDIKGENLVKGINLEGLRVLGDPQKFAKYYYDSGADELLYMDIVASLYNRDSLLNLIKKTAKNIFIPLTVGGGLRTITDIRNVLRAGADKVALNTAAVKNPAIIKKASQTFGSSTIVISIEAKKHSDGYEAYIDNGRQKTSIDVFKWVTKVFKLGAGEILVTSIDREGTGKGFDIELVKNLVKLVPIPVIACGGAGRKEHVKEVFLKGKADAVGIASLFHYNYLKKNSHSKNKLNFNGSPYESNRLSVIEDISIPSLKKYLIKNLINCRI